MNLAPTPAKRQLSIHSYRLAVALRFYLGEQVGVRHGAEAIAKKLPQLKQRKHRAPVGLPVVRDKMTQFVDLGLATFAPGIRGGAGWALTAQGAELVRLSESWKHSYGRSAARPRRRGAP